MPEFRFRGAGKRKHNASKTISTGQPQSTEARPNSRLGCSMVGERHASFQVLGKCAQVTRSGAEITLAGILRPINEGTVPVATLVLTFAQFVDQVYLPHCRRSWKDSTDYDFRAGDSKIPDAGAWRSASNERHTIRNAGSTRSQSAGAVPKRSRTPTLVPQRHFQAGAFRWRSGPQSRGRAACSKALQAGAIHAVAHRGRGDSIPRRAGSSRAADGEASNIRRPATRRDSCASVENFQGRRGYQHHGARIPRKIRLAEKRKAARAADV